MNIVSKISKRYFRKHGTYPSWEQMAATATKGEILLLLLYYDAIREAHETIK